MKKIKFFSALVVTLLLIGGVVMAQGTTSKIIGTVTDKDGTPLPGVTVKATNPKMVGEASTVTDENGTYRLLALVPGNFKLTFTLEGFQTVVRENIILTIEQTLTIKATMELGKIQEQIVVTGQAPLIDVKSMARGMTLTKEVFQTLPKGRNFDSLVTAIPGVSAEPSLVGNSFDGASGLENVYYIDGTDTTNIANGSRGQGAAFDFVDEVQVKSSGYQAEFGGSLGGVINVVTRSGGNEFHGEVVGYYSGYPLRTKYRDVLDLDLNDDSKAQYYKYDYFYGDNKDHRFEGGLNIGGYILKNKVWFFGSFLPVYYTNTRTVTYLDGVSKDWKRTENSWNFSAKITAQPWKNLRLSASVVNNFYKYKGELSNIFGNENPATSFDDYGFSYPNMSANGTADLTLGNNFLLSVRGGYFRTNVNNMLIQPSGPCLQFLTEAPGGYFKTTNVGLLDVPVSYQKPSGWINYPRSQSQVVNKEVDLKWNVGADLTYFLNLAGEHSWKMGVNFKRQGQDYSNVANYPVLFFGWDRDFIAYGENYGRGKYGYYGVRGNDLTGPYGDAYNAFSNAWSIYLQDSWTIGNKLTLNLGVRAESEYIPSYTDDPEFVNVKPIEFKFGDKIAPRLGFTYDVFGDSSMKIFGSFGYFYDVTKLGMAAGSYGGTKWKSAYYALDTYEWDKIGIDGYYPGRLLHPNGTIDFRTPSFDSTDPSLKPMSQQEISFGMEKKLKENLSMSLRVVNKHLRYAIEDVGVLTSEGEMYYTSNPGYGWTLTEKNGGKFANMYPDTPKAKREYWGVNLSLDKRFSNSWMGGASLTISSLKGNYSGLASGDEITTEYSGTGRDDPNTERYFDLWYLAYDRDLNKINGPLPGDRPIYFKAYGSYAFPFGLTVGGIFNIMSGVPTSTEWAMDVQGYFPFGRNSMGRTPTLWFANAYAEYNLKLGKNTLNINLNVDNLFDVKTAQRVYQIYNQGAVSVPESELLKGGWDIAGYEPVLDPRYGKECSFYGPLNARLGFKFMF